jgi:hypothetical protein
MRKALINLLAPAVLLAATSLVWSQTRDTDSKPDTKPPAAKEKDKEAPAKSQLEVMLEIALRSNPDIRVADAKAREADAELSRTRLAVTRKVVVLYNNLEVARANVAVAERDLERLEALGKSGVPAAELDVARAKLMQAKADLAKLEAEVPFLLGQQKIKWQKDDKGQLRLIVEASADENYKDVLDRIKAASIAKEGGVELRVETPELNKAMSDKLRTALDQQVTLDIKGAVGPKEVLDFCRDRYSNMDINITVKDPTLRFPEGHGDVRLKDVPFGAVLQWMEDELPTHCFVVRDYGLVLVRRDQIPNGALRVKEFWKSKPKMDQK